MKRFITLSLIFLTSTCLANVFTNGASSIYKSSDLQANAKIVNPGDDIQECYDWLKSSDRDGQMGALSVNNRRTILLFPGKHEIASEFVLDTDYVDIVAINPSSGQWLKGYVDFAILYTGDPGSGGVPNGKDADTYYSPPSTVLEGDINKSAIVKQTCNDIRMHGFGIANLNKPIQWDFVTDYDNSDQTYGFDIACGSGDNGRSCYSLMYFWKSGAYNKSAGYAHEPVHGTSGVSGYWLDCTANGFAWRVDANKSIDATMVNCVGGVRSFGGDRTGASIDGKFTECRVRGTLDTDLNGDGYGGFGGCTTFGCTISSDAEFKDCTSGNKSYALGFECAGQFWECEGGTLSFGATADSSHEGDFSGNAINCRAKDGSFGGTSISGKGGLSGKLDGCRLFNTGTVTTYPTRVSSGLALKDCRMRSASSSAFFTAISQTNMYIDKCEFQAASTSAYLISNSAGGAVSISITHTSTNSTAGTGSDGLDTNVTNAVTTPYNVNDANVKVFWL
jgi:hypothetical protein